MSIELDCYEITLTLLTPMLGTAPGNKEIYRDHIIRKAEEAGVELDEEDIDAEVETVPEMEEKGMTVFRRIGDNGPPCITDYMVRGFFKAACGALRRSSKTESSKVTAYKRVVDTNVFIVEREIPLALPDGTEIEYLERPLRADTAQGPRVAIACSESAPENTSLSFTVEVLAECKITEKVLREWLDYGRYHGLGQWRGGGYGCFAYEMKKIK